MFLFSFTASLANKHTHKSMFTYLVVLILLVDRGTYVWTTWPKLSHYNKGQRFKLGRDFTMP